MGKINTIGLGEYTDAQLLSELVDRGTIERIIEKDLYWNMKQRRQFSTNDVDSFSYLFAYNSAKKDIRGRITEILEAKK